MTHLPPGSRVGPYTLVEPIGSGATAQVYRARRAGDERPAAVKLMNPSSPDQHQRFQGEVTALRRVSHPGIVEVLDAGEQEGRLWLAMELVLGMPLDDWANRVSGATRLRHVLRAGLEVAEALDAVHELGILHRDVKPANVLVESSGRVKLVDFGFAGHVDRPEIGGLAGTLRYMSPERLSGQATDRRSDLFSLGVVLFELLARRAPHIGKDRNALILAQCTEPAPSVAEFAPEVPDAAVAIIDRLLAKAPSDRPRSGHEVSLALRAALAAEPREARWRPVLLTSRYVGHKSLLDDLVRRILAREAATLLVHGPDGIGLSRLLQEIEGRALVRKARPVLVRGDGRPLFRVLEELVGPLRPAEARRALLGEDRDLLLAAWPELRRTTEDVISLLRPPTPHDLTRAVQGVLARAAAQQPLVVAVDDAELADPRDLLLLQGAGVVLLASHHPERVRLRADRIQLPPLDREQLAEVASSMLGPAGPGLVWEHASSLGGRPGRLASLARRIASGRPALPGEDDRADASGALRVRPWQHAVREAEALLGSASPSEVQRVLDEAALGTQPDEVRFRAELVQARAALNLGALETVHLHARQAEEAATTAVERSLARLTAAQAVLRDGDLGELEQRARVAAGAARRLGELDLACRWDVFTARVLLHAGGLRAAQELLEPYVVAAPDAPDLAIGTLWTAAEVALHLCDWDQCRALLVRARERSGTYASRRLRAGLRASVGELWLRRGQVTKASEQLERSHQDLARTEDLELLARVRALLAEARLLAGGVDEASRLAMTALETADQAGSRRARPHVARVALRTARVAADLSRLRDLVARGEEIARQHAEDPWAAPMLAQLALGLVELGEVDAGRTWLQRATTMAPEDPYHRLQVRLARAALAAWEDRLRPDVAVRLVDSAGALGLDHLSRMALGFTTRWTGSAAHRNLDRLVRQARAAGDSYGACWLGIAMEQDARALRGARSRGFLAMAEGRALPA